MLEWNIADDEGLDARMPKPHSYDAIVTFDGEEVAGFNQEKPAARMAISRRTRTGGA